MSIDQAPFSPHVNNIFHNHAAGARRRQPLLGAIGIVFRQHFSPLKTYIRRDLGLAVVLNPKVGSTTFRQILFRSLRHLKHEPLLGRYWPLKMTRRYFVAPPGDFLHALLSPHRYRFYCFVRNPYSRILSAWKDKLGFCHETQNYPRSMGKVVPAIRRFAGSMNLQGAAPGSPIPFATFLAYVESQPEGIRNHHWDTQRSVLFADRIDYHRVFRMESDFAAGMTEILTQLGVSSDWVAEQIKQPRNASRQLTEPAFDARLAEQVHRIFAADFDQFGYAEDSWQGL